MPNPGWMECGLMIGGQPVRVAVRRLGPDEAQRVAAEIAWFADGLLEGSTCAGWQQLLDRILTQDVAITMDEELFHRADAAWDQLVCRAFETFVVANGLDIRTRLRLNVPYV